MFNVENLGSQVTDKISSSLSNHLNNEVSNLVSPVTDSPTEGKNVTDCLNENSATFKNHQFCQMRIEDWQALYTRKLITATAYVYGIIRCKRQDGWWLSLNTKEFAIAYGIPKTSLHRALSELAADPYFNFEWSAKEVRVRFGGSTNGTNPTNGMPSKGKTAENIDLSLPHSQQGSLVPCVEPKSHAWNQNPMRGTEIPCVEPTTPETPTQQDLQPSYRYLTNTKQIQTDNALPIGTPLPHPEQSQCVEDFENQQEECTQIQPSQDNRFVDKKAKDSLDNAATHEAHNSAPPPENHSQYWQCPDSRLRRTFMAWLSETARGIQTARHAANWCNKNPQDADLAWDDFMKSRDCTSTQSASYAAWHSERHEMLVREYKSAALKAPIFRENFIAQNSTWLQWVKLNHPEWLEDVA